MKTSVYSKRCSESNYVYSRYVTILSLSSSTVVVVIHIIFICDSRQVIQTVKEKVTIYLLKFSSLTLKAIHGSVDVSRVNVHFAL